MSEALVLSSIGLWLTMGLLTATVLALARQIGLIHRRFPPAGARMGNPGPKVGQRVPQLETSDLYGQNFVLGSTGAKRTLLVFLSLTCQVCKEIAPALRSISRSDRSILQTVLAFRRGEPDEIRNYVKRLKLEDLPVIPSADVADKYEVSATPYALLLDEQGVLLTKGLVNNIEHLESLIKAAELGHPSFESLVQASGDGSVNRESGFASLIQR